MIRTETDTHHAVGHPSAGGSSPHNVSKSRRWVAAVVTLLLGPGLGHIVRGQWLRGAFWFVGAELTVLLATVSVLWVVGAFGVALGLGLLLRLAAMVDVLVVDVPAHVLPSWRTAAGRMIMVLLLALGIRQVNITFVAEAFKIPSGSMIPTLLPGDHVYARKVNIKPVRGDVVVFARPDASSQLFIKRVVALEGDTVAFRDDRLYINGQPLKRQAVQGDCLFPDVGHDGNYVQRPCQAFEETLGRRSYRIIHDPQAFTLRNTEPERVPRGSVYLLGDNRDNSHDSRHWGPVKMTDIVGIVEHIWWSSGPEGVRWQRLFQRIR